ncbi:MAG: branched-chain amino acid ABC transporter permease [Chloroflexi bacterium HGW-Chloroflexi-4]|jgi:4-azaleucine resistance transporter AzlC|nr:MAG: branched-chain amino acid ABC transporter permease [Chloroflexi bacterium HGW-Chloroflexi-4]
MINTKFQSISFVKRIFSPALPVVMGYIPVGFAYGVLGVNAGISTLNTILMSLIVFAGSAQLMATGFFSQGLNPFSIIITTFIVNLRHMLMSASLSSHMKEWKKIEVAGFCYELTDETFAVHSLRFNEGDTAALPAMSINLICQLSWVVGTILGALAGNLISDVKPFALDYALPAMFIALLILQVHNRKHVIVAIFGAVVSIVLWKFGITQWNVILATVIGATLGAVLETSNQKDKAHIAEVNHD